MKAQVYKDPRPKEYFDRFHERSRTREPDWVYEAVRVLTSLYAWTFFRARGIAAENVPDRAGDHRPEPLLVHGPLLRRRVHPPARALHGQVAAVHAADAVGLHARRRVPGAARLPRRGRVHHRQHDPGARRADRHVLRGRPLAHGQALRAAQARHRPARAGVGRDGRPGRDPRLLEGPQLEAPAVPQGHRPVRRADALGGRSPSRRPTSSSRSRTRSSPRSAASTRSWTRSAARASRGRCARRAAPPAGRALPPDVLAARRDPSSASANTTSWPGPQSTRSTAPSTSKMRSSPSPPWMVSPSWVPEIAVVARAAVDLVVAVAALDRVVALVAEHDVVAEAAEHLVVAGAAVEDVVAVLAVDVVVALVAEQLVVAALAEQRVGRGGAEQRVVAGGAADDRRRRLVGGRLGRDLDDVLAARELVAVGRGAPRRRRCRGRCRRTRRRRCRRRRG